MRKRKIKPTKKWETKSILTELSMIVLYNLISRTNLLDKYCLMRVNRKIRSCSIQCLKDVTALTVTNGEGDKSQRRNIIPWRPFARRIQSIISFHPNLESLKIANNDGGEITDSEILDLNFLLEQCQNLKQLESHFSWNITLSIKDESRNFINLTHLKLSLADKQPNRYLSFHLITKCPNLVSLDACILPCCHNQFFTMFNSGIKRLLLHFHSCFCGYPTQSDPSYVFSSPAMSTVKELSITGSFQVHVNNMDKFQAPHLTSLSIPNLTRLHSAIIVSSLKRHSHKLKRLSVDCDRESESLFDFTRSLESVCATNISTSAISSLFRNNCNTLKEVCLSTDVTVLDDFIVTVLSQCENLKVLTIGPKQLPSNFLLNFVQDRSLYLDVNPFVVTFKRESEWMGHQQCDVMYITTFMSEEKNWWSSCPQTKSCYQFHAYHCNSNTDSSWFYEEVRMDKEFEIEKKYLLYFEEKDQRTSQWSRKNQGRRKEKKRKHRLPTDMSKKLQEMSRIRSFAGNKKLTKKKDNFQKYYNGIIFQDY